MKARDLHLVGADLPPNALIHAENIKAAYGAAVAAIVATGAALIAAKNGLAHGLFLRMINTQLPFGVRTAQTFMQIARHPWLSKAKNFSHLPVSVATLGVLARLSPKELSEGVAVGRIGPETRLEDAKLMVSRICQIPAFMTDNSELPEPGGKLAEVYDAMAHMVRASPGHAALTARREAGLTPPAFEPRPQPSLVTGAESAELQTAQAEATDPLADYALVLCAEGLMADGPDAAAAAMLSACAVEILRHFAAALNAGLATREAA